MTVYPQPIADLIKQLSKLPGIGQKSAMRLVLHLLNTRHEDLKSLAQAIGQLQERITLCSICHTFTDREPCSICADERRDRHVICVVEGPADLLAIEQTVYYRGLYHVLHGVLSPLDGIGPENLKINSLVRRVESGGVDEVILATNPTVEGEATANYIQGLLKARAVAVTRIASGVPVGGDLKFADPVTLKRALDSRSRI
jgi:recombination protein RecR